MNVRHGWIRSGSVNMKHGEAAAVASLLALWTLLATASRRGPLVAVTPSTRQSIVQAFATPSPFGNNPILRRTWRSRKAGSDAVGWRLAKRGRLQTCAPKAFPEVWGTGVWREQCIVAMTANDSAGGGSNKAGGSETREERCVRRLDVAVRRVFAAYYTCSDLREAQEPLRVFLLEAMAALEAGESSGRIASLLEKSLLRNSQRLDYHLDGDLPMVLYRLWLRGRAIDVYERDLFHCPRWIALVSETKKQVEVALHLQQRDGGRVGTICYPNGDIFEGEVNSLARRAQDGGTPPTYGGSNAAASALADGALDAEFISPGCTDLPPFSSSPSAGNGGGCSLVVEPDVTTVEGLVALTIDCLRDGLSDEAAIFQRHMKSPEFGNPLLRLALPSSDVPEFPHMADEDEDERDPAIAAAEAELTEEHLKLGERGTKELVHDRRRSQLDVYLICEAFRALRGEGHEAMAAGLGADSKASWQLGDEDARTLDQMLNDAAAIDP